jgi:hypothetical protein
MRSGVPAFLVRTARGRPRSMTSRLGRAVPRFRSGAWDLAPSQSADNSPKNVDLSQIRRPTHLRLGQLSVGPNFGVRWRRSLRPELSASVPKAPDVPPEAKSWLRGIDPQHVHDPWRARTREERRRAIVAHFDRPTAHEGSRESRPLDGRLRSAVARTVPALNALSRRGRARRATRRKGTKDGHKNDELQSAGHRSDLIHRLETRRSGQRFPT